MVDEHQATDDGLDVELTTDEPPNSSKHQTATREDRWLEAFHAIDEERNDSIRKCQKRTKTLLRKIKYVMMIRCVLLLCLLLGVIAAAFPFVSRFWRTYVQVENFLACNDRWSNWTAAISENRLYDYKRTQCSLTEYIPAKCVKQCEQDSTNVFSHLYSDMEKASNSQMFEISVDKINLSADLNLP